MSRAMKTRRRLAAAAFLLLGVGGCAGRMEVGELAHQFDAEQLKNRPVAIGGVILGRGVELDGASLIGDGSQNQDPRVQADTWSAFLYRPFLVYGSEVAVWPWPTVAAQADPVALATIHEVFARGGIIKPDQLEAVARSLPEVGYLALARIEETHVTSGQSLRTITESQKAKDGRDVHADHLSKSYSVRRHIRAAMEIYDLSTGLLEWTGTVTRRKDELYNPKDEQGNEAGIQIQSTPDKAQDSPLTVEGTLLRAPSLEGVLADACEALVKELTVREE